MNDERDATGGAPGAPRRMSRLRLLAAGAAGMAGATALNNAPGRVVEVEAAPRVKFFTNYEFALVTAMAEVIWPTDDAGPGAKVAGVAYYIDGQLDGGWGRGDRWYMSGPFIQPADSGHGWQSPMVPRDVYRACLPAVDNYARAAYGNQFTALDADTQAKVMTDLSGGKVQLALGGATTFSGSDFFGLFRQNVLEGMLSDPSYGGNKDMVGWKWIGFPGDPMGRGDPYADWVFSPKTYPYEHRPTPLKRGSS
jgi:gluconate 2-dehydrogenase gamma chain